MERSKFGNIVPEERSTIPELARRRTIMTDIPTTLSKLTADLATFQTGLATATALGGQAASVAAATRAAATAIQSVIARTQTGATQVAADGALVTAAIAARKTALDAVVASQGQGGALADAAAAALKTAVAKAKNLSEADLDGKGVAAVKKLDSEIAALGATEATTLQTAQTDRDAKQASLAKARGTAQDLLAKIQASAASVSGGLAAALADQVAAQTLAQASDKASHDAAVVAYADYAAARAVLANEVTTDPTGSGLQGQWTTAANAWLSALGDAAAAEEAVIDAQLALDTKLAEHAAKQQTRDADAAAAVAASFGP
jgi:hypothetical protein